VAARTTPQWSRRPAADPAEPCGDAGGREVRRGVGELDVDHAVLDHDLGSRRPVATRSPNRARGASSRTAAGLSRARSAGRRPAGSVDMERRCRADCPRRSGTARSPLPPCRAAHRYSTAASSSQSVR
jgi:hypothetical protein